MAQQGNPSSELQGKQLGSAVKVEFAIVVVHTASGCDYVNIKDGEGWQIADRGWTCIGGHWHSERAKFHSFYASRPDAEFALKQLPGSEKQRRADPSDPMSPIESTTKTSYEVVALADFVVRDSGA